MKDLKNLKGAKSLSKNEQRSIKGGLKACDFDHPCGSGWRCINGACYRAIELIENGF